MVDVVIIEEIFGVYFMGGGNCVILIEFLCGVYRWLFFIVYDLDKENFSLLDVG